jgi:hypothetical protein
MVGMVHLLAALLTPVCNLTHLMPEGHALLKITDVICRIYIVKKLRNCTVVHSSMYLSIVLIRHSLFR